MKALLIAALLVLGPAEQAVARQAEASPTPGAAASPDVIRIWGPPAMRGLIEAWTEAYRAARPGVSFELTLKGSDTAIPGLYGGLADIALMGRRNDIVDDNGFSRTLERTFVRFEVANGSLTRPGQSDAIAVLVHEDNPLRALTLAQLAAVVDCGGGATLSTWGQLGLTGDWSDRPIRVHAYDLSSRTGRYFQHRVTNDGRRMCWDRIVEYGDHRELEGTLTPAAERVGAGARADPYALVIANPAQARDGLKLVGLGEGEGVQPTAETLIARRYPLARAVYAFVDPGEARALRPEVRAFLIWVLSPEGQARVGAASGYLPLAPASADHSQTALDSLVSAP